MKYYVFTPPYGDMYGYGSDVAEVEAETKRKAKVLGLRELRRTRSRWIADAETDNRCPFSKLNVEVADDQTHE